MEIFKQIATLKAFLDEQKRMGKTIGLVPTMGALHRGHLSLVEASKNRHSITVSSIYVNPAQFNNPDDLKKYPKTLDKDTEMLKKVGCDVVFVPENEEMYPEPPLLRFDFGHLDKVMEGKFRPGHFSGVALVVSKFFNIVQPHEAFFGQKDWQQFAIIRRLAEELHFGLKLQTVPTVREANGLAMSSRNLRLSEQQRDEAGIFYKALTAAKTALNEGKSIASVKHLVSEMFHATAIRLEYFEVSDSKNLTLLENVNDPGQTILCIAGFCGDVRLIDNMFLDR